MKFCSPEQIGFQFLARLSAIVLPHYRSSGVQAVQVPRALDASWLTDLPLPLGDGRSHGQTVALVDGSEFHREVSERAIRDAYEERPRTRVYESISARSDGWFSFATLHFSRLVRCQVVCTMYESNAGDQNLIPHVDQWFGVIVQMRGAKRWRIWPNENSAPQEKVIETGDVLLLPRGVKHEVRTPDYSVHLVFAITDEPI
ncbi:JmjC domain-containing protein [Streptomyces scopuliridis]|uniref:JmjC domain-containing protein n=1 Tax=Streptomyces scopuliridis TaxID=452529 RepID=UPI00369D4F6D